MSGTKKYPCRCYNRTNGIKCNQRKSLRKKPEHYVRQPKCPNCGKRSWAIDKHRLRVEMAKDKSCDCGGYHFIHRKGSKMCHHHPEAEKHHNQRYEGRA